ncbi:la-related protein 4B isoform 2-T2 [Hipposideros larvatus]
MGCCFSKELSGDNDTEKTGLLQKSVEEKEPEHKISKTLSALFGTLQGEGLHSVKLGASRTAAGAVVWSGVFAGSGHKQARRTRPPCNSTVSSVSESLARYDNLDEPDRNSDTAVVEQSGGSVCTPPCVSAERTQAFSEGDKCLSYALGPSDQGMQEGAPGNNPLCHHPVTCKSSVIEGELLVNVHISCGHENNATGTSGREPKGMDHKRQWNSIESKFYSICVVDPGGPDIQDEPCAHVCGAAAAEESLSAVTSERTCRGTWPPDNAAQGPWEELSPRGQPGLREVKEVSNEQTKPSSELLTDSDPPSKVNTGGRQAESFRANTYTKLPKDYPERTILHNVGRIPESNTNIDTDSLECVCAIPRGESHSSAPVSPMGDPRVNVTNDIASVEQNGDLGVVNIGVDQSLNSKKAGDRNSIKPLKDNSCSSLDVSGSDRNLPSLSLGGMNLSSERCSTSVHFGSACLPVGANFQETVFHRCDNPRPEHLGPMVTAGQYGGDCSLGTGSKGDMCLQPENHLSYQDEAEMSVSEDECCGRRALERRWLSQVGLWADTGARKAPAQACDLTRAVQEAPMEGVIQRTHPQSPGGSQEVAQNSPSGVQSNFMSSAFLLTCTEAEESEVGPTLETEGKLCEKSSGGDPHRLENAEEDSLQANHREASKNDTESVTSDSKTVFEWEANMLTCKALHGQDLLACVSSSITKNAALETDQVEQNDDSRGENDCRQAELPLVRPVSSVALAGAGETCSLCGGGGGHGGHSGQEQVYARPREVSDAVGHGAAVGHKEKEGLPWGKDNSESSGSDYGGPCGTSRQAHCFKQRNATATVKEPTLNHGEVGFVGSSRVNGGKMELGDTLAGYSCLDRARVDRHTAAPQDVLHALLVIPPDSKETEVPSSEDQVLSLSEDSVNRCEDPLQDPLQGFPEELDSQCVSELSCYMVGGVASHLLSERLADGCGYPVGCLWANADELGDRPTLGGDLHCSQPQDLAMASFWMGKPPPQLPMAEGGVIWGWQNGGTQLKHLRSLSDHGAQARSPALWKELRR